MIFYITITALQKIILFVNVMSRVIWNQAKLTQAKIIEIILLLRCDVVSSLGPTKKSLNEIPSPEFWGKHNYWTK